MWKSKMADLVIIRGKANIGAQVSPKEMERMAKRRFQDPRPKLRGDWWTIRVWRDQIIAGKHVRKQQRIRLAAGTVQEREVRKIAAEYLRPMNQGLECLGSATNFEHYIETIYKPVVKPLMATTSFDRTRGVLDNYLLPAFGRCCLRELTPLTLQTYFSQLATSKTKRLLSHESRDKIRDVLSSALRFAVQHDLLVRNPAEALRIPPDKRGRKRNKPYLTPQQFGRLVELVPEPYASMVYVAIYTGLRVSELAGLRWNDIGLNSITVDERFCRGDWGAPKSEASNATIGVNQCVIDRILRLKDLTVEVKAGRAVRKYKVVKSDGSDDLVFQGVRSGGPIRDNNILVRFIKPAARTLGLAWVNWRSLRTSHATWLKMAGADVKDAQAQMRHSRSSTTLDIYQQFVPESQQRVVEKLSGLMN
jgi:integrase